MSLDELLTYCLAKPGGAEGGSWVRISLRARPGHRRRPTPKKSW
jgi:hypothetical protein